MPGASTADSCSDKRGLAESSAHAATRKGQRAGRSVAVREAAACPGGRGALATPAVASGVGALLLPRGRSAAEIKSFCLKVGDKT